MTFKSVPQMFQFNNKKNIIIKEIEHSKYIHARLHHQFKVLFFILLFLLLSNCIRRVNMIQLFHKITRHEVEICIIFQMINVLKSLPKS